MYVYLLYSNRIELNGLRVRSLDPLLLSFLEKRGGKGEGKGGGNRGGGEMEVGKWLLLVWIG